MKKLGLTLIASLLVLSLAACGPKTPVDNGGAEVDQGRTYNAFTLATSLTLEFDGYANWHSSNVLEYGTGVSSSSSRFVNAENDALLEKMKYANPVSEKDVYQEAFLDWIKLMNKELPVLPIYANDYHDLYNAKLQNFNTTPLWQWPDAIVEATGMDTFSVGNTSFNNEFIQGWGNSSYDNNIRKLVYGFAGLVTGDHDGAVVKNYMVDSYDVTDDMTEWTFNLKKGIKFSDGSELTTKDVAYTYYHFADPSFIASGGAQTYQEGTAEIEGFDAYVASCEAGACDPAAWTGLQVIDDYTIKFITPNPTYTIRTSVFTYYIMSAEQCLNDGVVDVQYVKDNLLTSPMGTGPYMITDFRQNEYVKLEINPYFEGNIYGVKPSIKTLLVKVVPTATEVDQLIAGEVDLLAGQVQATNINAAKAAGLAYNHYLRHGYGHMTFHTDTGAAQYTSFRQAVAFALDREAFVADFLGEYGGTTQGPYSLNQWMLTDVGGEEWVKANLIDYTKDPAKAREVLEADGWVMGDDGIYVKDGIKAVVHSASGSQEWVDSLNLVTADSVKESGILFDCQNVDFAVLLDAYYGSATN